MFKTWKAKRRRKKAKEKIRAAVYAFVYLNNALIHAHISRQVRRQLKHDLMTRDDPEIILKLFLEKVESIADKKPATIGNDKGNRRNPPSSLRPVIIPKGQNIQIVASAPQENIESPNGKVFRAKES